MASHLDMGQLRNPGRASLQTPTSKLLLLVPSLTEDTALYSEDNSHGMFSDLHLTVMPAKYSLNVLSQCKFSSFGKKCLIFNQRTLFFGASSHTMVFSEGNGHSRWRCNLSDRIKAECKKTLLNLKNNKIFLKGTQHPPLVPPGKPQLLTPETPEDLYGGKSLQLLAGFVIRR